MTCCRPTARPVHATRGGIVTAHLLPRSRLFCIRAAHVDSAPPSLRLINPTHAHTHAHTHTPVRRPPACPACYTDDDCGTTAVARQAFHAEEAADPRVSTSTASPHRKWYETRSQWCEDASGYRCQRGGDGCNEPLDYETRMALDNQAARFMAQLSSREEGIIGEAFMKDMKQSNEAFSEALKADDPGACARVSAAARACLRTCVRVSLPKCRWRWRLMILLRVSTPS